MRKRKIYLLVGILALTLVLPVVAIAQTEETLPYAQGFANGPLHSGTPAVTTGTTYSNAITTSSGLDIAIGDKVLVVAGFSMSTANNEGSPRTGFYRFNAECTTATSADCYSYLEGSSTGARVARGLAGTGAKDYGMAVLVHIFDHTTADSSRLYSLQHRSSTNQNIQTHGTISAIRLKSTPDNRVPNAAAAAHPGATTTAGGNAWQSVQIGPSSQTELQVVLPEVGGIFVSASWSQVLNTAQLTGDYVLEYDIVGDSPDAGWQAASHTIQRSTSNIGAVTLTGALHNQSAATYKFRLRQRDGGTCCLQSENVSMVAVALGIDDGGVARQFNTGEAGSSGVVWSDTSSPVDPTSVQNISFTLGASTGILFVSGLTMSTSDQISSPYAQFYQAVDNSRVGAVLYRYFDTGGGTGSGAVTGVTTYPAGTHEFELFQSAALNTTLTTRGIVRGFVLTTNSVTTFTNTRLRDVALYEDGQGKRKLRWETTSEAGTVGYYVERWDPDLNAFVRVEERLVPAAASAPAGARYEMLDKGLASNSEPIYRIVEVEWDGNETRLGTFRLQPKADLALGGATGRVIRRKTGEPEVKVTALPPDQVSVNRYLKAANAPKVVEAVSSQTYPRVRVLVEETGVYRLDAEQLAELLGVDSNEAAEAISENRFALSHLGAPVPYMTVNEGAGMLFFGEAIESIFARNNVYWLDWGHGRQMPSIDAVSKNVAAAPNDQSSTTFRHKAQFEENNFSQPALYRDATADFWFWEPLIGDSDSKFFNLEAPGALSTGQATFRAFLHGGTDLLEGEDHRVRISFNGQDLGETIWDGLGDRVFEANIDQSGLNDGLNSVEVTAFTMDGETASWVLVEGFELDYWRRLKADEDSLLVRGVQGKNVVVSDFSSEGVVVLDVSNPAKPKQLQGIQAERNAHGSFDVGFSAQKKKHYWLTADIKSPLMQGAELPALDQPARGAEYLIVTPGELETGARELAEYRSQDYRTEVVLLEHIYDAFNGGIKDPNAIHEFLKFAYENWSTVPRFVTLVGKGTYDPKNYKGLGTDKLPVLLFVTPHGLYPADALYADLAGEDAKPDVALGRLPVLSNDELSAYVRKLEAYESSASGTWSQQASLIADNRTPVSRFDLESERVGDIIPESFEISRVYHSETTPPDQTRSEIFDVFEAGALVMNYVGHGAPDRLDHGILTIDDVGLLPDASGKFPIFTAFSCGIGNGSYLAVDSLSETLVLEETRGAIAVIAPTGVSDSGVAHDLNRALYSSFFEGEATTLGEAMSNSLKEMTSKYGKDHYMMHVYGIFGDPAIPVGW